jgi:hypothetical protein
MFVVSYTKKRNLELFKSLDENYGIYNLQNYLPIYNRFFKLTENNYNSINLNNKYQLYDITNGTENIFDAVLKDASDNELKRKSFFKFSPLLDPVKYMVGKYKHIKRDKLEMLPKLKNENNLSKKKLDENNAAYIDGFFSYLSSMILHKYKFYNGIDYYGSFLGIQENHTINIFDDLEYLYESKFFHNNNNDLFKTEEIDEELLDDDTRSNRKKIKVKKNDIVNINSEEINNDMFDGVFELTEKNLKMHDNSNIAILVDISKNEHSQSQHTESTCSSRSSNTEEGEEEVSNLSSELISCSNSELSGYSSYSNNSEIVKADIYNFPVNIISLELLDATMDSLLDKEDDEELEDDEWKSCLFQVIISLLTYQKMFNLTHNDLHSNNIMYKETDKKFLYYRWDNKTYKVPTYGKIFKIIDFGRAIYNHSGKIFCSDSFNTDGDASSQYNCEPYYNKQKKLLEPNKSFDLCRLACSIYDYFFVNAIPSKEELEDPIAQLILKWASDDKGRNILYKKNGEERYPEFKLYKMIVRTVHNHTPENEIKNPLFDDYIISNKKAKKKQLFNLDAMPSYI